MKDALHAHHGEVVAQAVVAEVVSERAFRLQLARHDRPDDAEVGVRVHRVATMSREAHAPTGERAGKRQLGQPLRQRHHRGQGHGWRATDEDADA
jgi:hypothetical protein